MCTVCLLIVFVEAFINVLSGALMLAIFVRVLQSWVPLRLPWGLGEFCFAVSEPILSPIRRALPGTGGIDFSPFIALLAIQAVSAILLRLLPAAIPF
jgi:YggT family protein